MLFPALSVSNENSTGLSKIKNLDLNDFKCPFSNDTHTHTQEKKSKYLHQRKGHSKKDEIKLSLDAREDFLEEVMHLASLKSRVYIDVLFFTEDVPLEGAEWLLHDWIVYGPKSFSGKRR